MPAQRSRCRASKAILTADDLPAPADSLTDNGVRIPANKLGERGLTNEPLYQGEPILAVAAVDELTAAEAIEKIKIEFERLPFVIDPLETPASRRPECTSRRQRLGASACAGSEAGPAATASTAHRTEGLKWTEADFDEAKDGKLPMGKIPEVHDHGADGKVSSIPDPANSWKYGDVDAGFKKAALVLDETFVTPDTSHHAGNTQRHGVLAERQSIRSHRHAEHHSDRSGDRAAG